MSYCPGCADRDANIARYKIFLENYGETVEELRSQLSEAKALVGRLVKRLESFPGYMCNKQDNEVLSSAQSFLKTDQAEREG